MSASPREVFARLLAGVTGRRWSELPELYAPDCVVTHPLQPPRPEPLVGREALRAHFAAAVSLPFELAAENVVVHETTDPEVVVGEFDYRVRMTDTDERAVVHNIFVLRVRDGLIVESRDYTDHLTFARLTGRLPALVAAMTS